MSHNSHTIWVIRYESYSKCWPKFYSQVRRIKRYFEVDNGHIASHFFRQRLKRLVDSRIFCYWRRVMLANRNMENFVSLLIVRHFSQPIFEEAKLFDRLISTIKGFLSYNFTFFWILFFNFLFSFVIFFPIFFWNFFYTFYRTFSKFSFNKISESERSDQYTINLLSTLMKMAPEVQRDFTHLNRGWRDLVLWAMYPWIDLIDDLTNLDGRNRKVTSKKLS